MKLLILLALLTACSTTQPTIPDSGIDTADSPLVVDQWGDTKAVKVKRK